MADYFRPRNYRFFFIPPKFFDYYFRFFYSKPVVPVLHLLLFGLENADIVRFSFVLQSVTFYRALPTAVIVIFFVTLRPVIANNMIVFNTTYSVHHSVDDRCVKFLTNTVIPSMLDDGFSSPLLMQIEQEVEPGYRSYALQFFSPGEAHLQPWLSASKRAYECDLAALFGEKVLSFSTIMRPL